MAIQTVSEIVHQPVQEASEAALTLFRGAVRPIYGVGKKNEPQQIGSALLFNLSEGHFIVTAAHVIDWNDSTTLYIGADNFAPLKFEALVTAAPGDNRDDDHADFAIAQLDNELLSQLTGAKFITEAEISHSVATPKDRVYTCLGYPNSKNKVNSYNNTKVTPILGIYTSLGKSTNLLTIANAHDHILVDHNAKYSRDESGAKVNSVSLPGFSGGAIIDVGPVSVKTLGAVLEPKIAALLIEGHKPEKVILGTRITSILDAMRKHFQIGTEVIGGS